MTPSPAGPSSSGTGRTRLVAVGLATACLAIAALVLTHPWGDRIQSQSSRLLVYDALASHRAAAWPSLLLDAFCVGLVGICLALATCSLVRTRGRTIASIGAVVAIVGGLVSAMAGLAYATLTWYVTAVPESSAAAVIRAVDDHPARVIGPEVAGFMVLTLGSLVLAVALFVARAVPRTALAAYVVLTLLLFVGLPARATDVVQIAQVLLTAGLAIPAGRGHRGSSGENVVVGELPSMTPSAR